MEETVTMSVDRFVAMKNLEANLSNSLEEYRTEADEYLAKIDKLEHEIIKEEFRFRYIKGNSAEDCIELVLGSYTFVKKLVDLNILDKASVEAVVRKLYEEEKVKEETVND